MKKSAQGTDSYVTQSQWAEGMEMIKDFFGKVVGSIDDLRNEMRAMRTDLDETKKYVSSNTDSLGMITREIREIKNIEFKVYDHEKRIKKLEKVR